MGNIIVLGLWGWDVTCRRGGARPRLAWHLWKKYMCRDLGCVSRVAVNVSQPCCVSSQHGCCALFILFILFQHFISSAEEFQHLFNKSKKGCKQNALSCSSHDWRAFPKKKAPLGVQSHANSISLIPVCSAVSGSVISVPKGGKIKNPFIHQTNPLKR